MTKTVCLIIFSQLLVFGTIDRIQKAMEKKEYEKALDLIRKGYEKEPLNPGISYYHAKLFFDQAFKGYNIDTARLAIERARKYFDNASTDLKEDVIDEGVTLEKIDLLYEQIRDRAFQNTLGDLSIDLAAEFQRKFPNSVYDDILTYKVDSMEFRLARNANSEIALSQFIKEHPASVFMLPADSILDGMRFDRLQGNGSLKNYYNFHESYPLSRHKDKVERYILKVSTASHLREKYRDFIAFASTHSLKKKAADVLYYLSDKTDNIVHPVRDSLQDAIALSQTDLYPVVQNQRFGFYDRLGAQKIDHEYPDVADEYKCELTSDDWVYVKGPKGGLILTKNGKVIMNAVDDYKSITTDLGLVQKGNNWFLYHKSGFQILEQPIENAELIANRWIKVKQNEKWGLISYMGLQIAEVQYDDIYKTGAFWVFEKEGLLAVYTEDLILKEIEERGLSLEFKFDDIEMVNANALIGLRDERECLLDSTLNFLIPWGYYEIYPEVSGWYLKSDQGYRFFNESESDVMDQHYSYLESNEGWLALKTSSDWMLLPRREGLLPSRSYDSIKLVSTYATILIKEEQHSLLFSSGKVIVLEDEQVRTFPNHPKYLSLSDGINTTIYNENGEEVITGKFERTTFLNDSLIRVQIRGRQGLIHRSGNWVLNPVFDTIDEKDGLVLTLIDGKIGCYDPLINKLITTEYEARMERIKQNYLAKKEGKFGVIDHVKNEIISFNYDEIRYWNDSSFLVKKDGVFSIINTEEEEVYEPFATVKLLLSNERHSIFRFVRDGRYGLISTHHGELLGSEFTDVYNIGSREKPLFFADQHLDKAGFHVVSYITEFGDLILSKAYSLEEFEKILCDN